MVKTIELIRTTHHLAAILEDDGKPIDIMTCSIRQSDYENSDTFRKHFLPKLLVFMKRSIELRLERSVDTVELAEKVLAHYNSEYPTVTIDDDLYRIKLIRTSPTTKSENTIPQIIQFMKDTLESNPVKELKYIL